MLNSPMKFRLCCVFKLAETEKRINIEISFYGIARSDLHLSTIFICLFLPSDEVWDKMHKTMATQVHFQILKNFKYKFRYINSSTFKFNFFI